MIDYLRFEFAHSEVVQEKQRLGTLNENVVDAVIYEVATDRGVHPESHGHFQLGADAVGAGDQHRLFPLLDVESKQAAKTADAAKYGRSKGAAGMMPDALFRVIGNGDVDTCVGVFHEGTCVMPFPARGESSRAIRGAEQMWLAL